MATARVIAALTAALLGTGLVAGCGSQPSTNVWSDGSVTSASSAPSGDLLAPSDSPAPSSAASSAAPSASPVQPVKPSTAAPKPPPLPGSSPAANALLDQINAWRTAVGLRPYTMLPGLIASAHKHNLVMIAGCGLSHLCPNEAKLGDRIKAEGVRWTAAGENIAYSGFHANTTAAITAAAKGSNTSMFNEKPPDDGHRRNLLSKTFTHIGIDVVRDSRGRVWLTEDFTS